jgi:hypothetical protein
MAPGGVVAHVGAQQSAGMVTLIHGPTGGRLFGEAVGNGPGGRRGCRRRANEPQFEIRRPPEQMPPSPVPIANSPCSLG